MSDMPKAEQLTAALVKVNTRLAVGLAALGASYVIFILLISWLNFQGANSNFKIWLVKVIPLLILVPGLIKKNHRAYSWLCFVILPYFIFITPALFEIFAWKNWVYLSLTVVIFIAAMMVSRWLQQQSHLRWQISNTPSH